MQSVREQHRPDELNARRRVGQRPREHPADAPTVKDTDDAAHVVDVIVAEDQHRHIGDRQVVQAAIDSYGVG
ncbi:MAG: hypothetical protein QOG98_2866, partial [Pseudonocardiales bacterium]|nr:hypothetical protein [Pseudonocardiales bacterium]